ncbi:hypothetical protein Dda_9096 [Drechslerella dactyloides]|uniref:Uncharacterized protein n=1 Tax=Drechslerella dactyloides TaxID=74499 RepID=A0AAD6IRK4_DREDA|nr:hypothetical protein Dda_9096 [Drechslerella dactyloides]
MPFDFKKYDEKCAAMSPEELQLQWEHYTRLISGAATSTAVSGVALPLTMGVSAVGVALAAPAIHNARKKREIIERHLNRHGTTHVTRKRDVLTSVAISGTIGVVTMGASSIAADAVTNHAAEYGIQQVLENELAVKVGTHVAFDAAAMAGEHAHTSHKRKKEALRAQQQGRIGADSVLTADSKQRLAQEVPPDGFYPAVPIPQGYGTVQHHGPVDPNCAYSQPASFPVAYPGPDQTPASEYPPPPQYPGPSTNPSIVSPPPILSPTSEKPPIVSSPDKGAPIPGPSPPPNFPTDSKFQLVVETKNTDSLSPGGLPAYVPPPPGTVQVVEKLHEQQTYPLAPPPQAQQHYPPPSVQPSVVQTYPSYPGTMLERQAAPQIIGPSTSELPIAQQPAFGTPNANPPAPTVQSSALPVNATAPTNQTPQIPFTHQPPSALPPSQSTFPMSQPQQQDFAATSSQPRSTPHPVRHDSYPSQPTQQTNPYQQQYPPPPPPQTYVPHAATLAYQPAAFQQQGAFPPPPPPPSGYIATPAPTPGPSYQPYLPSAHPPPTAYPTGYPTPLPTPYSEYPSQQGYMPEKQGFPQYQEVPIPAPQILSQQGQYMEKQAMPQYQPSNYAPAYNMYGY